MPGIKDLNILLTSMKPELIKGEFVFYTLSNFFFYTLKIINSLLIFHEKEGVTVIIEKKNADKLKLFYQSSWVMITLTVH